MGGIQKIKILFISHESSLYGAQISLLQLLNGINRDIYELFVITDNDGPLVEEVRKIGIAVLISDVSRWITDSGSKSFRNFGGLVKSLPSSVRRITKFIEAQKIDVVYTNTVTCIGGAIAAKIKKKAHIWHIRENIRNNLNNASYIPKRLIPFVVAFFSDQIITNSYSLRADFFNEAIKKIDIVYNGINVERFSGYIKGILKKDLSIGEDKKLIGIIGGVFPNKGHETFLRAAQLIKKQFPNVVFIVVGDGQNSFLLKLKHLSQKLGIYDSVYFLGWRGDIEKIMQDIDLLIVASEQETFSRVVIEAMAAAKPVVSTRCGGPEEIIVNGVTGLLVPVGDAERMTTATVRILTNNSLSESFGKAGRERAESVFSEKRYVSSIETLILKTVRGTESGGRY